MKEKIALIAALREARAEIERLKSALDASKG